MENLGGQFKMYPTFYISTLTASLQKMPRTVPLAACQIFCIDSDRDGNFARIEHALKVAKGQNAEIACFPETCLLGWVNPEAHQLAEPIPGKDSKSLAALAQKYQLMLCVGLAEKDGEKLYDSVILIDSDGNLLLKHRKMNILTSLMAFPYTLGETVDIVETRFGRIGLLICADTFQDEVLSRMAEKKPDLVIVPYGWAAKKSAWPQHGESLKNTVAKAARSTGAPIVGTNLVGAITHGPWTGYTYGGQSVIAGGEGNVLAVAKDRDADVILVELPLVQT